MKIAAVVACGQNNEIGAKGDLLWNIPEDMKHFTDITRGHHVLMGRKSYESLPEKYRPLPNRTNIVVTRNTGFKAPKCIIVNNIKKGIEAARVQGEKELMIIGGAEIYNATVDLMDVIYLTIVQASFPKADTYFSALDMNKFTEVSRRDVDTKSGYRCSFIELRKK
jgi:dihydrofolate reductase